MPLMANDHLEPAPEKFGPNIQITPTERFVTDVYASVDAAIACEVDRLRGQDGIVPSCKKGCWHCCRYHILTNAAEGHALAQFIRRYFSAAQLDDLRRRTQDWHTWDSSRPGRYPAAKIDLRADLIDYDYRCPLLVNGACSAYPVRPVVCRSHLVRSDPMLCLNANNPNPAQVPPVVLNSVVMTATPFSGTIKDHIEKAGLDFSLSTMLLPHWLAAEMHWDFSPSP